MANTEITLQNLSSQANSVTANTDILEMMRIVKSIKSIGNSNTVFAYANTMPTANSQNIGFVGYADNDGLYINDGTQYYNLANTYVNTYSFQGSNYGYNSGGLYDNAIDKFPFASNSNASEIGQITVIRYYVSGQSSADYGYTTGHVAPNPNANVIDRFPFATDGSASDVGDLTTTSYTWRTGQSSQDYGYVSGGGPTSPGSISTVERWSFATGSENASSFADLSFARKLAAGISDGENGWGYTSGGLQPDALNIIDKFPFASGGSASDVGDLTVARAQSAGQSSTEYGYTSGGNSPTTNQIDKFPFASNDNATDVGDLTVGRTYVASQSSTDYGYSSGGKQPDSSNVIDRFPFAAGGNASDVGDLTDGKYSSAGQQY